MLYLKNRAVGVFSLQKQQHPAIIDSVEIQQAMPSIDAGLSKTGVVLRLIIMGDSSKLTCV